ncbi:MAG TPA: hypothetical protein VKC61_24040 [Pyrinomonadaceae bacterium]|nr:hypothetical protein [Pyrinomonadaceae bacterium]
MNLPGFTAEESLYETNLYETAEVLSQFRNDQRIIIPQARILDGFCIGNGSYCCFRDANGKWTCGKTQSA